MFTMLALLFLPVFVNGQSLLNEDFSGGAMPPDGWTIPAQADNWSVSSTGNAGGEAPEAMMSWSPQFNGVSRLVSPSLDLSGNSSGILLISFRHMIDHYGGNYTVGLGVRSEGGDWESIWEIQNPSGDISSEQITIELESAYAASGDFQLSLYFSGISYNINFWYIDDIQVVVPQDFDLAVTELDVPDIFSGTTPVSGAVANMGTDVISSFDLNWQLDDGSVFTTSYDELALSFGEVFDFEADDMLDPDPGSYELTVFVSNVNGGEADDDPGNDSLSKTISVASEEIDRRPMFEMFTSSTCPPCQSVNEGFFNDFTDDNANDITLIKYQMDWPGSGDPYYTAEGGERRQYYGVSAVPEIWLEGDPLSSSYNAVSNGLQEALQMPSFLEISGFFETDATEISIEGSLTPYADFPEARLHVVIIESVTYDNTGGNGETEFHHVMHKMLPDAHGVPVTLLTEGTYSFSYTFDMASTNVEEMDDLKVVVFVQDHESREVYQSAYVEKSTIGAPQLTFDPADGATDVPVDQVFTVISNQTVRHADGQVITSGSLPSLIELTRVDQDQVEVPFTADITEENTTITITPEEGLDYDASYQLNILSLMGEEGHVTETHQINVSTPETTGITDHNLPPLKVYPNPVADELIVDIGEAETAASIRILSLTGRVVYEKNPVASEGRLDVSSLEQGFYFVEVSIGHQRRIVRFAKL